MKKLRGEGILLGVLCTLCFNINVNAQTLYTNSNGVKMTTVQYDKMLELFSERRVDALTQEEFDYFKDVEIVGTATTGEETYYKILTSKPDMTFVQYDFKDLDSFEIMEKSKETLQDEMPVFNLCVGNADVSSEKLEQSLRNGCKLNALVNGRYEEQSLDIIYDYQYNS